MSELLDQAIAKVREFPEGEQELALYEVTEGKW
jgi:hypothetical protein